MTQISPKAQVILNWLKDPTTKRYIGRLLEDEKQLEQFATAAMHQAVNSGLVQRSEDEIKAFSNLKATRILLSQIPHGALSKEELTENDVKELETFFEQLPN